MASDYSVTKFDSMERLLFWHGRNSYKIQVIMCLFVIHRGLIMATVQLLFSIIYYNLSIPVYDAVLLMGWSSIFTAIPNIAYAFEIDVHNTVI
mmetsp:Transcript_62219/g.85947  ORF Transcript_62219/g.85947 Transcript_62219/m.85947 type:complete len:93 (-) Transcript_62219:528-806(-)